MLTFRKGLTKEQHEEKSRAILARLYEEPRFQQAKTIFAYASMPDEVQLYDLLAHALILASEVDFVVVPGAAFSPEGDRLGLGGGYYDRYLAEKAPQAYRTALTFDGQVVPSVPMEAHDARVNLILTETRRIEPNK
ncbi:5-formyltetrahydrofolate cyclo-ligase [Mitsuokella multacida]|uniref:5-formyltetrahydrofolate cyclo-ligase n=1 Tax=Mitsuokella multacida TaxID=52226 RepID=UPI003FF0E411